jgi:hypothetical protein
MLIQCVKPKRGAKVIDLDEKTLLRFHVVLLALSIHDLEK